MIDIIDIVANEKYKVHKVFRIFLYPRTIYSCVVFVFLYFFMRTLIGAWRDTAISLSKVSKRKVPSKGLPFNTYAPGGGGGQASHTFPLCITCKKGVGGSR